VIKNFDVAIIDYGLNNLFSVKLACKKANLSSIVTSDKDLILSARSAILPGVGAFSYAMSNIKEKKLDKVISSFVESGKPFLGICLGMQLLMERSEEFGTSKGLGILKGEVLGFEPHYCEDIFYPVPQVGWNKISKKEKSWDNSLLNLSNDLDFMYFVHSYYVKASHDEDISSYSQYGKTEFCASISKENISAMQFHPEKSGLTGLNVYHSLKKQIKEDE